jgi:hypothetical protein
MKTEACERKRDEKKIMLQITLRKQVWLGL